VFTVWQAPMVPLIPPMPGMKTSTSPGAPEFTMRSTASAACSVMGRSSWLVEIAHFEGKTLAFGNENGAGRGGVGGKIIGDGFGIERGGHDDHFEIRAPGLLELLDEGPGRRR